MESLARMEAVAGTRQFEWAMERALRPGVFIDYRAAGDFIRSLESVAGGLESLVLGEPGLAAELYEAFIGACHEKAEEIDDSGGNLSMFVLQLFVGWVGACQAARRDAADTVRRVDGRRSLRLLFPPRARRREGA